MIRQQGTPRAIAAWSLACCLLVPGVATADQPVGPTDQEITDKIEDELLLDPSVNVRKVDVKTYEGITTLSGTVPHLLAKDRAEEIAQTVKGVRGTVNMLKIKPIYVPDDELEADIVTALLMDPVTDSFEIDVKVTLAKATLSGEVESFPEKRIAERIAKGVQGVTSIQNDITLELVTARPDTEILNDIRGALQWDALIDHALIETKVHDGTVTLSGAVGSAAEKSRARFKAFVAGVRKVEADDLKVMSWARDAKMRTRKYVAKTDAQIADAVEDAFFYDPRVASFKVDAEVSAGVATLRGTVDNLKAFRSATATAKNVVGVRRVKNRIKVRPQFVKDLLLEQRVRSALIRDPYVDAPEVEVSVDRGEVTLTGEVDSSFEKAQADDAASRVNGVLFVDNDLSIEHDWPVLTTDPYVDYDWSIYDYGWYSLPMRLPTKPDAEIQEDIESELWWSPFVDEEDILVSVEDGVATLKGSVSTYAEWMAARENAREGGATRLEDRLTIIQAKKEAESAEDTQ